MQAGNNKTRYAFHKVSSFFAILKFCAHTLSRERYYFYYRDHPRRCLCRIMLGRCSLNGGSIKISINGRASLERRAFFVNRKIYLVLWHALGGCVQLIVILRGNALELFEWIPGLDWETL
jgi:hypothetical protein